MSAPPPVPLPRAPVRAALTTGVLFALVSAAGSAGMGAAVKALGDGASLPVVVFFRFTVSLLVVLPWVLRARDFRLTRPVGYGVRIGAALLALTCTFLAVQMAPRTNVLLLRATNPLFIPLLAALFLGTRTHGTVWLGMAVGFTAVIWGGLLDLLVWHITPQPLEVVGFGVVLLGGPW